MEFFCLNQSTLSGTPETQKAACPLVKREPQLAASLKPQLPNTIEALREGASFPENCGGKDQLRSAVGLVNVQGRNPNGNHDQAARWHGQAASISFKVAAQSQKCAVSSHLRSLDGLPWAD
jgi:hypothetical protein